jgi:pyruvate dehydrogenase E1 component
MRAYRDRLKIPIADDEIAKYPFYRPEDDSPSTAT